MAKSSAQKARARAQDAGSKLKFLVGAAVKEEQQQVKAVEEREEVESRNDSFDRKKRARRKGTRDTKAAGENAGWFC